jgi:hypothetical protein
VNTIGK